VRVVIVTGGTAGLGRAMVLALHAAGHSVVAVGRTGTADFAESDRLAIVRGDVSSPEECEAVVKRTIDRFGAVDALVNNAGINMPTRVATPQMKEGPKFYELSVDQWRSIMRTNVDGGFFMARLAAPYLVERGWGRIVNHVTSYRTMVRGGETPYGSSKAALESMTAVWANELSGTGVTVNAILPGGAADTRMIAREVVADRSKLVPPSMMEGPIRWLMSDASNGVTGRRFIAALWDANGSVEENVAKAGSGVGWPESAATATGRPWPPK
jgi:NAD(P)-dependent dehydrogenase (short-subunit alcohol dehydrogenase family)